jgi:hypothetical protein
MADVDHGDPDLDRCFRIPGSLGERLQVQAPVFYDYRSFSSSKVTRWRGNAYIKFPCKAAAYQENDSVVAVGYIRSPCKYPLLLSYRLETVPLPCTERNLQATEYESTRGLRAQGTTDEFAIPTLTAVHVHLQSERICALTRTANHALLPHHTEDRKI